MSREKQLVFCRKCLNRQMNLEQGIICTLTAKKATFDKECRDYKHDESVIEKPLDDDNGLHTSEIKQILSPELFERLKIDQHLIPGIVSGLIVGVIGAVLWGWFTVTTEFQIGFMAIAIGASVGLTVRKIGNGVENIFGFWGAGIALFSVILGNFLSILGFIANDQGVGYIEVLLRFNYSLLPQVMAETFSIIDLVFYGIAIAEGYRFSFRMITEKSIHELMKI